MVEVDGVERTCSILEVKGFLRDEFDIINPAFGGQCVWIIDKVGLTHFRISDATIM